MFLALVPDPAATEVLTRWLAVPANGPLPTGWRTMAAATWHVTLVFLPAVDEAAYRRLVGRITRLAARAAAAAGLGSSGGLSTGRIRPHRLDRAAGPADE